MYREKFQTKTKNMILKVKNSTELYKSDYNVQRRKNPGPWGR